MRQTHGPSLSTSIEQACKKAIEFICKTWFVQNLTNLLRLGSQNQLSFRTLFLICLKMLRCYLYLN